jgi:hypothetical protein
MRRISVLASALIGSTSSAFEQAASARAQSGSLPSSMEE